MKGFVGFNLIGELCVVISSELCYSVTGSSMVSLQYRASKEATYKKYIKGGLSMIYKAL